MRANSRLMRQAVRLCIEYVSNCERASLADESIDGRVRNKVADIAGTDAYFWWRSCNLELQYI